MKIRKITHTCGVFIFNNKGEFLICHPTNAKNDVWSIPKGHMDEGETELEAAAREVFEETNINITCVNKFHELSPSTYPNNRKVLHSFVTFEKYSNKSFDKFNLKCNSFVTTRDGNTFPEVDKYMWVTLDEAKKYLPEHMLYPIEEYFIEVKNR